jgi:Arc/MetJ-type ribon-helix-helix transcriptional regulator
VRANTVRLPEDQWSALSREAERTGQSTSELIRQAVTLHLAFAAALAAAEDEDQDVRTLLADTLRRVSSNGV